MLKPAVVLSAEQQKRLLQKALALPENQQKITAAVAKQLTVRVGGVYRVMLKEAGAVLRQPTMTQTSKVVRFYTLAGFTEKGTPRLGGTQFRVNWPALSPQYAAKKPNGTKDLFWKRSGATAAAYAGAIARRRGAVTAKAIKARLVKGGKLQTLYEVGIPSLPWPLNDLLVRPFVYGTTRTPSYSFAGYRGTLARLMFLEQPYGAGVDMPKRKRRYVGGLTGLSGERLDKAIEARAGRRQGGAPARPWLRQLASTFRRDMIRALAGQ